MFMILPDGTKFRLLRPDQITLTLSIRAQKTTGIGPRALEARLGASQIRMRELLPFYERVTAAEQGSAEESAAILALEEALVAGEMDLLAEGVHIWLSRLAAGEELSLEQACDFPLFEARYEAEPDEKAAIERTQAELAEMTPTIAAASSNGHASGKPSQPQPETTTST